MKTRHDASPKITQLHTGIPADAKMAISKDITQVLVDSYALLVKTHICHWNVVGPLFHSLHVMLEEQYNDLFIAVDVIAERIRALGHLAPIKGGEIITLGAVAVKTASATDMVKALIDDHEALVRLMREAAAKAGDAGDVVTEDMLVARMAFHEKTIWMLKATIAE